MNMSFALTTEQVRAREKTVTRRLRWVDLPPGTILQPIVKGQGIKKGGRVELINGPILVIHVRREELCAMTDDQTYGRKECIAEGFPLLSPEAFVAMFCKHNGCTPAAVITRIEFSYVE